MKQPPRHKDEPIVTKELIQRIAFSAVVMVIGTMYIYVQGTGADGAVTPRGTTMVSASKAHASPFWFVGVVIRHHELIIDTLNTQQTFTCFVLFSMWNALSCRSLHRPIIKVGISSNRMFNLAVVGCTLGQLAVIYLPFLQKIFQTEALGVEDLVVLGIISSSVWILDEGRKVWVLRTGKGELGGDKVDMTV